MADVHSAETRSYNMSRIRSKNTKPELLIRKVLFSKGYRFRLYDKNLPGKPDIVFKKFKTVIFVHGCFWHGHENCKYYKIPKTKTKWWLEKITKNIERDTVVYNNLEALGWSIKTIWECDLKPNRISGVIKDLVCHFEEKGKNG